MLSAILCLFCKFISSYHRGGLKVTVNGTNFTSVAKPKLDIIMTYHKLKEIFSSVSIMLHGKIYVHSFKYLATIWTNVKICIGVRFLRLSKKILCLYIGRWSNVNYFFGAKYEFLSIPNINHIRLRCTIHNSPSTYQFPSSVMENCTIRNSMNNIC